jgi:hypothetical protein
MLISEDPKRANEVTVSAAGTFLGYTVENVNKRIIPMLLQFEPDYSQTKYRIAERPPGTATVAKLCYRFTNMHASIVSADGSCFAEVIQYDLLFLFSASISASANLHKCYNPSEMQQWLDHLQDTDESGLPKAMVKEQWDRRTLRATQVQRGGLTYLD